MPGNMKNDHHKRAACNAHHSRQLLLQLWDYHPYLHLANMAHLYPITQYQEDLLSKAIT